SRDRRPEPSDETTSALLQRIRRMGLDSLPWSGAAAGLRDRVRHLARSEPDSWPARSDEAVRTALEAWPRPPPGAPRSRDGGAAAALLTDPEAWLGPHLVAARSGEDVAALAPLTVLSHALGHGRRRRLDIEAPTHFTLPSGRRVPFDYSGDVPRLSVRVQDMFG